MLSTFTTKQSGFATDIFQLIPIFNTSGSIVYNLNATSLKSSPPQYRLSGNLFQCTLHLSDLAHNKVKAAAVSSRRNGSGARAQWKMQFRRESRMHSVSGSPHLWWRRWGCGLVGAARGAVPASGRRRDGRVCARAAPLAPMRIPARRRALG